MTTSPFGHMSDAHYARAVTRRVIDGLKLSPLWEPSDAVIGCMANHYLARSTITECTTAVVALVRAETRQVAA